MMIFKTRLNKSLNKDMYSRKALRMFKFLVFFLFAAGMQTNAKGNLDKVDLLNGKTTVELNKFVRTHFLEAFKTITGTVIDNTGNRLSGVSVTVRGTQRGTSTDADGQFTIEANSGDVLQLSMIGYKAKTVVIGADNNVTVSLELEATIGTEIVIVGFGTQKKVNLTGSISTVDAKQLESRPLAMLDRLFRGWFRA